MGLAPFIMKVTFVCPECVKKQAADVEVFVINGKSWFAFTCERCKVWWIMEVHEASGKKAKELPPDSLEPQTRIFNRVTNELQPLLTQKIIDSAKIRIFRSIGKTIEVQPLGDIKLREGDLADFADGLGKPSRMKVGRVKMNIGNRGFKK